MARIFWVTCPNCHDRFYCHYDDLRRKPDKPLALDVQLRCPYCEHEFDQDDSPRIDE